MITLLSFFTLSGTFCRFTRPTVTPGAGTFQITNTVRCARSICRPWGLPLTLALLVADRQAVEVQPVGLAQEPRLDRRVLVQQRQVVAGDGGEVGAAVGLQHLVGWDVGQLDLGIAVRQHVEGVVVVHAALAGVPLQDHLLEGLEGEGAVDPALADGIADGLEVARADEVPQRHAVRIGDGEAVVRIVRVPAGDGEETAIAQGDALAVQRPG